MWIRITVCALLLGGPAVAEDAPLSAIDWLSDSVAIEESEQPISVLPLEPSPRTLGIMSPASVGLPADIWFASENEVLVSLLREMPTEMPLPMREVLATLVSVEVPTAGGDWAFLLARIDALLALGRIDDARRLADAAGGDDPALFRRQFDIALLTGHEDEGCQTLEGRPDMSPTYPARIFCLARRGDWPAAALTLGTAEALGVLQPAEAELIGRFLDDGESDLLPPPERPDVVTPLMFRLFEAIGEPLPTRTLPLAFAHADLRPQNGWKARIEAAERLYRAGAIDDARLLGIYLEREASASGGTWDRVVAVREWHEAETPERTAATIAAAELLVPAGLGGLIDAPSPPAELAASIDLDADPDADLAAMIAEGRRGEAALHAIIRGTEAWDGDPDDLSRALAALSLAGVEVSGPLGAPFWVSSR